MSEVNAMQHPTDFPAWFPSQRAVSSYAEYLAFLKQRVSPRLHQQILYDGAQEIELAAKSYGVPLDAYVAPLRSGAFPTENKIDIASVLRFVLVSLPWDIERGRVLSVDDLYVASLYLYCYAVDPDNPQEGLCHLATAIAVNACLRSDAACRVNVAWFFLQLCREAVDLDTREDHLIRYLRGGRGFFARLTMQICAWMR